MRCLSRLHTDHKEGLKRSGGALACMLVVYTVMSILNQAAWGIREYSMVNAAPVYADTLDDEPELGELERLENPEGIFISPAYDTIDPCTLGVVVCVSGEGGRNSSVDPNTHPRLAAVVETVRGICTAHGYGVQCIKDLVAMAWKESRFDAHIVGDQGRSHGWWQIQTRLHGVPVSCTADLKCAGEWTLTHLEGHGYPSLRSYAIKRHNGSGVKADRYAASVKSIADRLEITIK